MENDIWEWFDEYKAHCNKKEDYDEILSWEGSKHGSIYYMPDGTNEWDVIISPKKLVETKKLLKLGC